MRKIHKLLLPAIIFMMAIIQVKAQGTAGIDVIPNGGFEKWQDTGQPTGWRIVSSLNPEGYRKDVRRVQVCMHLKYGLMEDLFSWLNPYR